MSTSSHAGHRAGWDAPPGPAAASPPSPPSGPVDEMVDGVGRFRPHWGGLLGSLFSLPGGRLADGALRLRRAMEDDGFAALAPSEHPPGHPGAEVWHCDPVPLLLPASEFAVLERGLAQRAQLLDQVLRDLYGPQRLLAEGLVPPALVFSNPAFLRPCRDPDQPPQGPLMQAYAADLVRGPDGAWRVAADRNTRMAGLAQALENRRLLALTMPEIFRGAQVRPLRPFLDAWSDSLRRAAPQGREDGAVALLTPGAGHALWAEHVALARVLSCIIVEPGDLTARHGELFLKTLRGLHPISVLLRRMDGRRLDPVDFGSAAWGGVPGLMDAARHGAVRIVNDPGAGLAEAPALAAYLPALCRRLLGEELLLDGLPTRWLGDGGPPPSEGALLRPATDGTAPALRLAALDDTQRAALQARLQDWCETEELSPSMAPCAEEGSLVPRPVSLRLFLVDDGEAWRTLPGGLVHVLPEGTLPLGQLPMHGLSKDLWVLEEERVPEPAYAVAVPRPVLPHRAAAELPSRVADDLFWLGRLVERLDNGARLFRAVLSRLQRETLLPHELAELGTLTRCLLRAKLVGEEDAPTAGDTAALRRALIAAAGEGKALPRLLNRIATLITAARDRMTREMHEAFVAPLRELRADLPRVQTPQDLQRVLGVALRYSAGVAGVAAENMVRGGAHGFLDLGRRMERARYVAGALALALDQPAAHREDGLRLALELCDSVITYRTRYLAALQPAPVLDLVLADAGNPRGLAFQLAKARDLLASLASADDPLAAEAASMLAEAEAAAQEPDRMGQPLQARLDALEVRASALADAVSRRYFTLLPQLHTLGPEPAPMPLRGAA